MPDDQVLNRSVTRDDYADGPRNGGGVSYFMLPGGPQQPDLPPYWSLARDHVLRQSVRREAMWGSAIGIAITKMASLSWDVEGEIGLRVRRAQELFLAVDGEKGWVRFLSKHLRDFLTTDNGAFVEVIHQTRAPGSRVIGLAHLDACRVTRTGDPDIPGLYRDRKGGEHELRDHQLLDLVDMEDPGELWNGVGLCAASRAWSAILRLEAIEQYLFDKVSGRRPLAIYITDAVNDTQLKAALGSAEAQADAKGIARFMGAIVIGALGDPGQKNLLEIPLASLPDGFDAEKERKYGQLTYADAIGLDPQDLNPDLLASRAMGTGAQSQVIDDKASGKGLAAWRQQFAHATNWRALDTATTFYFSERDLRDLNAKADLSKKRGEFATGLVVAGVVTPVQATQLLVDQDELPKEFIPIDQTPDESLSDDEKPDAEAEDTDAEAAPAVAPAPAQPAPAAKAVGDVEALIEQELPAAVATYKRNGSVQ